MILNQKEEMRAAIEKVEEGYQEFLTQRNLPQMCAYELLCEDFYDEYERLVITKFVELFEAIDRDRFKAIDSEDKS